MLKGYLCIVAAAVLWGVIGPVSRLAFDQGVAPIEVAFWRATLAWACFGSHAVLKRQVRVRARDLPALLLFAVTGVTLFYGSYQLAVARGGAALAAVLLYTAPAWVTVLSRVFFKEPMTYIKLVALVATIAGVVGVSLGAGDRSITAGRPPEMGAFIWGLTAGVCYALYYIFGKHFSGRYDAPTIFLYILPIGGLLLLPFVPFAAKTALAWGALAVIAFFSTYLAYALYYAGLRLLEPSRAAITATLEPVVAAVVAYIWWREVFSVSGYAGGALILFSVVLVIWDGMLRQRNPATAEID
jgi:drug/metabolite transporter (DMT)-like permease